MARRSPVSPTWNGWFRDGAQLLGLDDARQERLQTQARDLAGKAARGIEGLEQRINGFEADAKARLKGFRAKRGL